MKIITAITAQKNNPQRVNVYLDGEFAFSLARIAAAWLKRGDALSEEKIARLLREDAREKAYQQALLFLSYRARSENEIRQNLRKHEFDESLVEETLGRLREAGFANDEAFALAWVENRGAFRPRGKRALTAELRQKGLSEETIRASLAEVDEEALAYAAAQKRAARFQNLEWSEFRQKLAGFLARRGFSYSVAAPVVARLWEETRGTAPDYDEDEDRI